MPNIATPPGIKKYPIEFDGLAPDKDQAACIENWNEPFRISKMFEKHIQLREEKTTSIFNIRHHVQSLHILPTPPPSISRQQPVPKRKVLLIF
jgi:hypothetical protein